MAAGNLSGRGRGDGEAVAGITGEAGDEAAILCRT